MLDKTMRVLIAEDDLSSREFLKSILERHEDIEVIGEVTNGRDLVKLGTWYKPDVVFVDIEMPKLDGMSAVKKILEKHEDLYVVFITGHVDFALEAFEISSFDYILKPYKAERVEKTIEKIRARFAEMENNLQRLSTAFKSSEKLYIKCGHELHFIDANSIFFVEKEQKKTVIHTTNNKYETFETINDIEKRLNPNHFFRSHKCYLINLKMVEKIVPWGANSYIVKFFNSNNDALISRAKVKMLYDLLGVAVD